jgi:hypothetical protein
MGFYSTRSPLASLEARMLPLETSVRQHSDMSIGKISELDTQLSILEDRSNR